MKKLDIKIDELVSPEYESILKRAEERIEEAILFLLVSVQPLDIDIETLSFPIAVMMVASTDDAFLKRRYALSESKRVGALLKDESTENILEVAKNFNWKIKLINSSVGSLTYPFTLNFPYFLRNASAFREKEWKLVNQILVNGEVLLTKNMLARLLEEEVRRHIEEKLNVKVGLLPQNIMDRLEQLKKLFSEKRGKTRLENLPKEVIIEAFPPCIKSLYGTTVSGHRISHVGRFTLTSFLINVGMSIKAVVDLFRSLSDFNERMTHYQAEHIAGERGSRTKYTPPRCDTLRTHGICINMDEICRTIHHPLTYYLKRVRVKPKTPLNRS